jgi:hypothetical protein
LDESRRELILEGRLADRMAESDRIHVFIFTKIISTAVQARIKRQILMQMKVITNPTVARVESPIIRQCNFIIV